MLLKAKLVNRGGLNFCLFRENIRDFVQPSYSSMLAKCLPANCSKSQNYSIKIWDGKYFMKTCIMLIGVNVILHFI